jgi:hypothetical protein
MYSTGDRGLSTGMPSLGHAYAATVRRTAEPPATAWSRDEMPLRGERSARRGLFAAMRSRNPLRIVTDESVAPAASVSTRPVRRPVMQVVTSRAQQAT